MTAPANDKGLTKKQFFVLVIAGLVAVLALALNFLSELSTPNSIVTLIVNTVLQTVAHFFSVGGILIVVILGSLFALFRRPSIKGTGNDPQPLFKQAMKLESSYKTQEALALYADIAKRFPETEVGRDAKISYEMLLKRIQP